LIVGIRSPPALRAKCHPPGDEGSHGGLPAAHEVGGLRLGQVFVEPEHDRGPLADRQFEQGHPQLFPIGEVGDLDAPRLALPFGEAPLHDPAAVMGPREVHDGRPEIGVERAG
jgi:hypothetical protein